MNGERTTIGISSGTIFRVLFLVLGLVFLYAIRDIIAILLFAIIIASAVDPIASWLRARGIPRTIGVLAVYLAAFAVLAGVVYLIVPPLAEEVRDLSTTFPSLLGRLTTGIHGVSRVSEQLSTGLESLFRTAGERLSTVGASLLGATATILGGVFAGIAILVISFYLSVREKGIENLLRSVTPAEHEVYLVDLWQRTQRKMGRWLQGQVLLGLIVAAMVYVGLTLLNVKFALSLALLAGIFEIIPIVGPILAAIPAVVFALSQSLLLGAIVAVLYTVIQQIESHIVIPNVLQKIIGLNPVIIILSLLVGAKLAGITGMLLAIPVAAALAELFGDLTERKQRNISE